LAKYYQYCSKKKALFRQCKEKQLQVQQALQAIQIEDPSLKYAKEKLEKILNAGVEELKEMLIQ